MDTVDESDWDGDDDPAEAVNDGTPADVDDDAPDVESVGEPVDDVDLKGNPADDA